MTETGAGRSRSLHQRNGYDTGAIALGGRLKGVMGSSLLGRDVTGEVRLLLSLDIRSDKATAQVAYLGNPGLAQTIRSADIGRTGVQLGAGMNLPVGENSSFYMDASADLRSGDTSVGGSLGYRYTF